MMRHPPTVPPGRSFPSSGDPYVSVAIPRMVAGNPNIIAAGYRPTALDNRARRPNPDKDFGGYSRTDGQHERQKESNECLAKHSLLFTSFPTSTFSAIATRHFS